MPSRLVVFLVLLLPLVWASGQDAKQEAKGETKYEDVLQKLVDTMGEMTKTLAQIVDDESAKAKRPILKEQAAVFVATRKRSQDLTPPSADAKETLAKKFRPEIEKSRKELVAQVARVQRLPGGNAALQEIRAVFDKKEP